MSRFAANTKPGVNTAGLYSQSKYGATGTVGSVRPGDWLTLPSVTAGEQKIVGLVAVAEGNSNFVAFSVSGNYIVNWGDGNIDYYGSGSTAQHNYMWSDVPANTLTSQGYRQAIFTITMWQGHTLTSVDFAKRHTYLQNANYYGTSPVLELVIAGQSVSSLKIQSINDAPSGLQRFKYVGTHSITSTDYLCNQMYGLRYFEMDFTGITTAEGMFYACRLLSGVKIFNTSSLTNAKYMFVTCESLPTVPIFDVSSIVNAFSMLSECHSLTSIPALNFSNATDMRYVFSYCYGLKSVTLSIPSATNTYGMFGSCYGLQSARILTSPQVVTATQMFYRCYSLQSVYLGDMSSLTAGTDMFLDCRSLSDVEIRNTNSLTDTSTMFYQCESLEEAPLFNTSKVTAMNSMFEKCYSLRKVPMYDLSSVTSMTFWISTTKVEYVPAMVVNNPVNLYWAFNQCDGIRTIDMNASVIGSSALSGVSSVSKITNLRFSTSQDIRYNTFSGAELNRIYSNLDPTAVGQTLTITGNWGANDSNRSIATSKGWQVVG